MPATLSLRGLEIVKNSNEFLKNNPHKGEAQQSKPEIIIYLKIKSIVSI